MEAVAEQRKFDFGRNSFSVRCLLDRLIAEGQIKAFRLGFSGISMKRMFPIDKVVVQPEYKEIILQDTEGHYYFFSSHDYGGCCYGDGDQDQYSTSTIDKLPKDFDPRGVGSQFNGHDHHIVPHPIVSRLQVRYTTSWKAGDDVDYVAGGRGHIDLKGPADSFLERIIDFCKNGD